MKILVTGAAGFIGSAFSLRLLERGGEVVGIDNLNNYYNPALKEALGKEAKKEFLPTQPDDVPDTWANVDDLVQQFDYQPKTLVERGVADFAVW